ncbi:hypothetical protein ACFX19_014455 [Malus domestica]
MARPMRIKVARIVKISDEWLGRRIGIRSGTSAPTSTNLLPTKLFEEHRHFLIDGVRECSNKRFQSSNSSVHEPTQPVQSSNEDMEWKR